MRQKGKHFELTLQGEQTVVLPKITLRKMCGLDLGIKHFFSFKQKRISFSFKQISTLYREVKIFTKKIEPKNQRLTFLA